MKQIRTPIVGEQYRDWTVIDDVKYRNPNNRATYWKVRCKCGYEGLRMAGHLVSGRAGACKSCCKKKLSFERNYFNQIVDRAKASNFELDIDLEYILDLLDKQEFKCALSDLPIAIKTNWHGEGKRQTASLDRIDNTKGYVKGNVQWLHKDINNMKHVHDQNYFIELCKIVSSKCGG